MILQVDIYCFFEWSSDRVYFYMRNTLHIPPNEVTVVNLSNIYKREGDNNKLYSLLQELRQGYIKIQMNEIVYGALVDAFAKAGDSEVFYSRKMRLMYSDCYRIDTGNGFCRNYS